MGRRLIHFTRAGSSISPATVCVIFLVVAVIGYIVLERGHNRNGKDEHSGSESRSSSSPDPTPATPAEPNDTSTPPTPATPASSDGQSSSKRRSRNSSQPAPATPSIYPAGDSGNPPTPLSSVNSTGPGDYSADDETEYDTDADEAAKRRLQKAGKPALKPPGSQSAVRKTQKFADGTTAATDVRIFDEDQRGTWQFQDGTAGLNGRKDREQREAEVPVNHIESRLPSFRPLLAAHTTVLERMDKIEKILFHNCLDGSLDSDLARETMADKWHARWGKLPVVIVELCNVLFECEEIIDVPALAYAMACVPEILMSKAYPAHMLIAPGFEHEKVLERTTAEGKVVRYLPRKTDGEGLVVAKEAARDLLLGWFVLPFRGFVKDEWRDTGKQKLAGFLLPPEITAAVGGPGSAGEELLKWLGWAGQRYLLNRAFTYQGAELFDGSARISISPKNPDSIEVFKVDITVFVPESQIIQEHGPWKAQFTPFWLKESATPDKMDPQRRHIKGWHSQWLVTAVRRCLDMAPPWLDQHFPLAGLTPGRAKDLSHVRLGFRRLIVRPGFMPLAAEMADLDPGNGGGTKAATVYTDEKTPVLMQLSLDFVEDMRKGMGALVAPESKGRTYSDVLEHLILQTRITSIKVENRRQNHWHTPKTGPSSVDHFDPTQVGFIMGLLLPALAKRNSRDPDAHHYADLNTFKGSEDGRYFIDVDLGGIMPYVPQEHGALKADFCWTRYFDRVKTYYIPFLRVGAVTKMIQPGMEAVGDQRLQWNTSRWFTDLKGKLLDDPPPEPFLDDVGKPLPAQPHVQRTFVVVVPSLDTGRVALHSQLDNAIYQDYVKPATRSTEEDKAKLVADVDQFIARANESVRFTTVVECQTTVSEPTLWTLDYTKKGAQVIAEQDAMVEEMARRLQGGPLPPAPGVTPAVATQGGDKDPAHPRTVPLGSDASAAGTG